ncbi:hypothetical protein ABBQ38_003619 [Trebouxia sp. C0009 RCD-2024]
MWIYVDRDYTKATIAIERHAWEASGEVMIWTEMPDDQLDGMTVDVFDSSFVHDKWSMMCHKTQGNPVYPTVGQTRASLPSGSSIVADLPPSVACATSGTPGQYWRTLKEAEAEESNRVGHDALPRCG